MAPPFILQEFLCMQPRDNGPLPDDLPLMAPAKDEVREFPASKARSKPVDVKAPSTPTPAAAPQPGLSKSAGTVLAALTVLVLALAGFAAYSWQAAQLANQQLMQASDRIAALEARLSSTDASVSESSGSLAARINDLKTQQDKLAGEVDKLWSSAWRENQKSITAQSETLKTLDKRLDGVEKQAKETQSLAKQSSGDITVVKAQVDAAEEAAKSIDDVRATVKSQQKEVEKLSTATASNKTAVTKLDKRMQETEDWASSFNEFRRQVNLQLEVMREGGKK